MTSFHALVAARHPLVVPNIYGKGSHKGGMLSPRGDGTFKYNKVTAPVTNLDTSYVFHFLCIKSFKSMLFFVCRSLPKERKGDSLYVVHIKNVHPKPLIVLKSIFIIHIQYYVIKFVSDLRQVGGFLWVIRFPPPIKLTVTI